MTDDGGDRGPSLGARPSLRVAVLADTHLQAVPAPTRRGNPVRRQGLPESVLSRLRCADAILHAGDVLDPPTLEGLEAIAPTWAVLGNNDHWLVGRLPPVRVVELAGVSIGMIHDPGPALRRAERLHARFAGAAAVVFGHTHVPCDEEGVDGQVLFNPGSPTQRRSQPSCTMGELDLAGGRIVERRIVPVS